MKPTAKNFQEELAFSSVASHAVFPGRSNLRVEEVAAQLLVTPHHVINLCELYRDSEGKDGMPSFNVAGGNRNGWRIPVSGYDAFIAARSGQATTQPTTTKPDKTTK